MESQPFPDARPTKTFWNLPIAPSKSGRIGKPECPPEIPAARDSTQLFESLKGAARQACHPGRNRRELEVTTIKIPVAKAPVNNKGCSQAEERGLGLHP